MNLIYEEARNRLLSCIKKENDCWIWQKSCFVDGYGQTSLKGKKVRAHRLSYFLFKGINPGKLYVCHTCDNRKCINPDHLWLGTAKKNTQDSIIKGRSVLLKGEKSYSSKLTEKEVKEIKELLKNGMYQRNIAKIYKVHQANICAINRKKIWSHI
jgi:hypothetical protein